MLNHAFDTICVYWYTTAFIQLAVYYTVALFTRDRAYAWAGFLDDEADAQAAFLDHSNESNKQKNRDIELLDTKAEADRDRELRNERRTAHKELLRDPAHQNRVETLGQMVPPFTDQDINTYHNLLTSKGSWLEDPQKILSEESMMVQALDPDIWSKPMSLFSLSSNRTLQFMRTCMDRWMHEWVPA
jgi:hypothetical protein